jgi:hypothetical protein
VAPADKGEAAIRVKPSSRFLRQLKADTPQRAQRVQEALRRLMEQPHRKGGHLEVFRGRPGYFTARITRGWRFLLRKERDAKGTYYLVVEYGSHEDIYGRR